MIVAPVLGERLVETRPYLRRKHRTRMCALGAGVSAEDRVEAGLQRLRGCPRRTAARSRPSPLRVDEERDRDAVHAVARRDRVRSSLSSSNAGYVTPSRCDEIAGVARRSPCSSRRPPRRGRLLALHCFEHRAAPPRTGWHHDAKNVSTTGAAAELREPHGRAVEVGELEVGRELADACLAAVERRDAVPGVVPPAVAVVVARSAENEREQHRRERERDDDAARSAGHARRGTRRQSGDEGVDRNGDEHQHEVDVRPAEEPDRALRAWGRASSASARVDEQRAEHEARRRA